MALSPKQKRFCEEYLIDLNASQAYKRAGYKTRSVTATTTESSKLMTNPDIQAYIARLSQERSKRTGITADKVLKEYARLAFSDITDVIEFDQDNCIDFKDIEELSKDITASIQSISSKKTALKTKSGRDKIISSRGIKLHDKGKAMEMLSKHTGLAHDLNWAIAALRKYGYNLVIDPDTGEATVDFLK